MKSSKTVLFFFFVIIFAQTFLFGEQAAHYQLEKDLYRQCRSFGRVRKFDRVNFLVIFFIFFTPVKVREYFVDVDKTDLYIHCKSFDRV